MEQLFGSIPQKKYSGEIDPNEGMNIRDVLSGRREEEEKIREQIAIERRLLAEEKQIVQEKTEKLKLQLHALIKEIQSLSKTTQNLSKEAEIASMQVPIEPGVYHLIFFEELLKFIYSFRKKIEDASIWLNSTNKRAQKMNYWGNIKIRRKISSFGRSLSSKIRRIDIKFKIQISNFQLILNWDIMLLD